MQYYSHVIDIPVQPPFDQPKSRFFSWLGNFVLPLRNLELHDRYWFTYYGDYVRYRVYTDKYEELRPHIDELNAKLGLHQRVEEKDLTLVQDLGHGRFLASNRTDKTAENRAYLILTYLHSIAELVLDNLIARGGGYWELEHSEDSENPNGSNFESIRHLLCNMTQVPNSILLTQQGQLLGTFWGKPLGQEPRELLGQSLHEVFLPY